jgi:hypothetical protein
MITSSLLADVADLPPAPEAWEEDHVLAFLEGMRPKLKDPDTDLYRTLFKDNNIDGAVLLRLTDEKLEKIGIKSLGHRGAPHRRHPRSTRAQGHAARPRAQCFRRGHDGTSGVSGGRKWCHPAPRGVPLERLLLALAGVRFSFLCFLFAFPVVSRLARETAKALVGSFQVLSHGPGAVSHGPVAP